MTLELEVFKKLWKEEIEEYGKTIPDGYTRDENGYVLTYKDSSGYWEEYTRDERGGELTYKNSNGIWGEHTRDEHGKALTYKDSYGYYYEYTRDENGKVLSFKDSIGVDIEYLFWGKNYNLGYDKTDMVYLAGCQELTYEECEKYYEKNKDEYDDSHDFIEAIREHQKTLTVS